MTFKSHAITHVGMVRKLNEDSYAERSDIGVWVVADGMGGHAAGEVASKAVTDAIVGLGHANNFDEMHTAVKRSLRGTNRQLLDKSDEYEDQRVPGATVVVLIIDGNQGAIVWCGDSRIYRCSDQQLVQLTRDHSHVQELVDQVDAVSIVVPTIHHWRAARPFLQRGVHMLLEKPIAITACTNDRKIGSRDFETGSQRQCTAVYAVKSVAVYVTRDS